ncbi:DUF1289 domain-containing protein [Shewanella sp. OMA3-2]|uniref:DUF1289 domain-containing protein n=1 Tax=Shewanella sp. OMA3-2 TaxID=2908650 RepID=UPI001F1E6A51|nr:DUF1289 domain-containing protein [Shewanella sp. OMA3-2]UJF20630.1 DUF1289 domain-containing protein [Shewanella sp. OMA3-2]
MDENQRVESPCIRQCSLDEQDICLGCHRTLDEILEWHSMDNAQKLTLVNELSFRAISRNRGFHF